MSKADRRARNRQNQQLAIQERGRAQQRAKRKKWIQWSVISAVAIVAVVAVVSLLDNGKDKASTPTTVPAATTTPPTTAFAVPAGCDVTKPAKQGNGKTY